MTLQKLSPEKKAYWVDHEIIDDKMQRFYYGEEGCELLNGDETFEIVDLWLEDTLTGRRHYTKKWRDLSFTGYNKN